MGQERTITMSQKPFVCLGCGDGNTGLYCLNCGEKLTAPKWTSTPPTAPGWYWWTHVDYRGAVIRQYSWRDVENLPKFNSQGHKWAGPLPEPKEP